MSITGTWTVFFEWIAPFAFPYQVSSVTFHADQTFTVEGVSGKWCQMAGMLVFNFNDSNRCTYAGNWANKSVTGIMTTFDGEMQHGNFYMIHNETLDLLKVPVKQLITTSKAIGTPKAPGRSIDGRKSI